MERVGRPGGSLEGVGRKKMPLSVSDLSGSAMYLHL